MMKKSLWLLIFTALTGLATVTPAFAEFGLRNFETGVVNRNGSPDSQAGSHPWEMTTSLEFNETFNPLAEEIVPDGEIRNAFDEVPAGFVGDPKATPKCTAIAFHTQTAASPPLSGASCPTDTQIGIAEIRTVGGLPLGLHFAVYNLTPTPGHPAMFGFNPAGSPVILVPHVRTGGDYGLTVVSRNTSETLRLFRISVSLWGVPADRGHDELRGLCLGLLGESMCSVPSEAPSRAFLSLPTYCSGLPLVTFAHVDSWEESGSLSGEEQPELGDPRWKTETASTPAVEGCDGLDFSPTLTISPESTDTLNPTGLVVRLHMPEAGGTGGRAEADLRDISVGFPNGMSLSPSAAEGLEGCSPSQIGLANGLPVTCPAASKVGTVTIRTPLLERPLEGSVYLAEQMSYKGNLIAMYVVAEGSGVLVKLAGEVRLNKDTGQVTAVFRDNPQQPFEELELTLFGGPRAALSTPPSCGEFGVESALTPWSSEVPVAAENHFGITSNCSVGFKPIFMAGTKDNQAGGFSPFSVTLSRADHDEFLGGVAITAPPGLLGMLSSVPLCGEPQAKEGTCTDSSRIGSIGVSAGPGSDPVWVNGALFLTGPYGGGPFGLSIVVPVKAGPFDLGFEKLHAAIHVDPRTAQIKIVSDPLPQIIKGIPLQLRTIHVEVDREGFMFNPTNCEPRTVEGLISSTAGVSAGVVSHFQAVNCATLLFRPKFTASSQATTSRASGASLDVKITYPKGTQANIRRVAVSLPKQLPSRLTTIQKACPEATFAANPASCAAASDIGTVRAVTPVLNVPLTGPAYLVSHGGAAFPDVVMVLQGQGVKLEVIGSLNISKAGITSSAFNNVPDAPISSFELKLPVGPHSALTANLPKKANHSLCGSKLRMPTTIMGQNGAVIKQITKVGVVGCPKRHATHKKARKPKGKRR